MSKRSAIFCVVLICGVTGFQSGSVSAGQSSAEAKREAHKQDKKMNEESGGQSPLICVLDGLNPEQRKRWQLLLEQLRSRVQQVRELSDGYALRLPAETETILATAEFIALERLCCPFFKFEIEIASESRPMWVSITGREGVKEFLKAELGFK